MSRPRRPPELPASHLRHAPAWGHALARVLRRWRAEHDVTAQQLAERSNLDTRQVHRFEGREGNPTLETIVRLAFAMEMTPAELIRALDVEVPIESATSEGSDLEVDPSLRTPRLRSKFRTTSSVKRVAHTVRAKRERLAWTQAELASRTGLSRSKIQSIESERHAATLDTLDSLARALGCDVSDLLDGSRRAR